MADKKKRNSGLALSCWIAVALILVIFFFAKKDVIVSNLKQTDFFNRLFGSTPTFVENHQPAAGQKTDTGTGSGFSVDTAPAPAEQQVTQTTPESSPDAVQPEEDLPLPENSSTADNTETPAQQPLTPQKPAQKKKPAPPAPKETASFKSQLCFVVIDSDGAVSRKMVTRTLPKSAAPLADSIKALLAGPTADEKKQSCATLIPSGTRLLGASIKDGTATLNFSDEFEINPVGVEGYIGQLTQIVYTATSFPTVNSVQFIINGEKKEYLGSEGQWIGSPLSRSSFR